MDVIKVVGGCCEKVELLSAPVHDRFQPIKGMTPVLGEDVFHLLNPLEVMLKLTEPTAEVVYSAALSRGTVEQKEITPREDGM